jgi:hypothetical protein
MKYLFVILLFASCINKSAHKCVDNIHLTCDGHCDCDGMECNKIELKQCKHNIPNSIVIIPADTAGHYIVIFEDEKTMELSPEEIAIGLKTGKW